MRRVTIALALSVLTLTPAASHAAGLEPLVTLQPVDRARAASVPVIGGKVQRAVTREWLARFGNGLLVRRVRFFHKPRVGLAARVDLARSPATSDLVAHVGERWQANLFSDEVGRALRERGRRLVWVDTYVGGKSTGGGRVLEWDVPDDAPTSAALAADVDRRARESGLDVSGVVRPLRPAALSLEVRLREPDLFATIDGWTVDALLPQRAGKTRPRYDLRLVVRSPVGGVLYAASGGGAGGSSGAGPESGELVPADPPPPELLGGTTALTIEFSTADHRGNRVPSTYVLTCGAVPSGVPDAAAVCDRVLRDRWALLGPASGYCLSGYEDASQVRISGTVADRPVRRSWGSCGDAPVLRWAATLGVSLG